MEVSSLNSALGAVMSSNPTTLAGQVSMAMLDKSLEQTAVNNKALVQMMERSVTPAIGGNFDMSV